MTKQYFTIKLYLPFKIELNYMPNKINKAIISVNKATNSLKANSKIVKDSICCFKGG